MVQWWTGFLIGFEAFPPLILDEKDVKTASLKVNTLLVLVPCLSQSFKSQVLKPCAESKVSLHLADCNQNYSLRAVYTSRNYKS